MSTTGYVVDGQDIGNFPAKPMAEDTKIGRNSSLLGPNWKPVELGLVGQSISKNLDVAKLDGACLLRDDGVIEHDGLDSAIRQLNETRDVQMIHGDDDVTQEGKLGRGLGIGLALTTGSGCEHDHGVFAFADRDVFHRLRHEIVHGRGISQSQLRNHADERWLKDWRKVPLVCQIRA